MVSVKNESYGARHNAVAVIQSASHVTEARSIPGQTGPTGNKDSCRISAGVLGYPTSSLRYKKSGNIPHNVAVRTRTANTAILSL